MNDNTCKHDDVQEETCLDCGVVVVKFDLVPEFDFMKYASCRFSDMTPILLYTILNCLALST